MVIVDVQIAFDVDLHAEPTVGRDLIQHVIEEADAGVNFAAAFAVQPHFHVNLRLFGVALNVGVTVAFRQLLTNRRPV
ncbi:hypothetical protein D3C87_1918860 [compost metagenome]